LMLNRSLAFLYFVVYFVSSAAFIGGDLMGDHAPLG